MECSMMKTSTNKYARCAEIRDVVDCICRMGLGLEMLSPCPCHYPIAPESISHRCLPLGGLSSIETSSTEGSHIRTVLSSEHEANMQGSRGFHATQFTAPYLCPSSVASRTPVSRCHM